jgi:hypothetical protein
LDRLGKTSRPQVVRFNRIIHGRALGTIEASPCLLRENDDAVVLMDVQMRGPERFETVLAFGAKEKYANQGKSEDETNGNRRQARAG